MAWRFFFSVFFFSKWSKGNQGNQTLVCLKLIVRGLVRHKDVWHCFTHCKHGKYHFVPLIVSGLRVNVLLWTCAQGWCYEKDGWEDVNVPCTLIDGGCYATAGGCYAMAGVGKGMLAIHCDDVVWASTIFKRASTVEKAWVWNKSKGWKAKQWSLGIKHLQNPFKKTWIWFSGSVETLWSLLHHHLHQGRPHWPHEARVRPGCESGFPKTVIDSC